MLDTKERLGLRFVNAHDAAGRQWPLHYLRPEAVEAMPGDPEITSPALNVMCLQQHGLGYAVSVAPQQMCAVTLASWQEATMPVENDATDELIVNAHQVDPGLREDMVLMAMVSKGVNNTPRRKPREVPKILVSIRGNPVWMPHPQNVNDLKLIANGPRFEQAMETFMDRVESVDGRMTVAPEVTIGHPKSSVSWIFSYGNDEKRDLVEKARLVWNHREGSEPGGGVFSELTASNVARPLHWKALVHVAMTEGAELGRLDITNAHQTTRRGPEAPMAFSRKIPGMEHRERLPDGSQGLSQWLNYLNGMPPAGRAFNGDVHAMLCDFGMRPTMQDDHVYAHPVVYLKIATNVDDILVAHKDKALDKLVAHLSKRWTVKRMELDGWLQNQFYLNRPHAADRDHHDGCTSGSVDEGAPARRNGPRGSPDHPVSSAALTVES